ncbi:MFS transporter [Salicibibacter cibarius]|uniref:MFS transporter n=1 Tax=Salicibibacter cibarius TaxID=2743000 RepID=A0A7T7CB48_9BACI|nr:MFS transporter [Salicibibacter cibarius]QQK75572.1 MFS transporter [Salicibibacter cibarius]
MQEQSIQVFMEYKIAEGKESAYQAWIKGVANELTAMGAENFRWFEALEQPGLFVELFTVPSVEIYERIKDLRRSREHPRFGELANWVHKPLEQINCWAFRDRSATIEY